MSEQNNQARAIFLQAIEIDSQKEQARFLNKACIGDEDLRDRVDRLIASHRRLGSFHDDAPAGTPTTPSGAGHQRGSRVGPYKLRQLLGEGGMGEVYVAKQAEPVERLVAVKIIKAGMDSRHVIARFEAERQALALMDHPNIAKVFDAGTTETGRPYFVMELVKGVPITQYCDDHRLNPRNRLELFRQVCYAVQHAHQKGIIHRDIKPSNVLVAEYDDVAVPKIIDFGIAKATQQRLTDTTVFTEVGTIVGTIEYMSPEQAKLNQLDIDTRSDIYSLGVLLYELLIGEPPFDRKRLRSTALDEMLRIIREEEPSRPSIKLGSGESLPSIAASRHVDPKKLGTLLRGELDWIVMKALEKERSRRYETASAFAQDIAHFLNDEAVSACPPSPIYRFRKFARQNRAAILTTGIVLVSLLAGITGTTLKAIDATRGWEQARMMASEALDSQTRAEQERKRAIDAERETAARAAEFRKLHYQDSCSRALAAFVSGDVSLSRKALDHQLPIDGQTDHRDFEWWYVNQLIEDCKDIQRLPLPFKTTDVDFSHDGLRLAISHKDGLTTTWDITGHYPRLMDRFPSRSGDYYSPLAFSRADYLLAHTSPDPASIVIRDLDTGEFWDLSGETRFLSLAFSPNGRWLAAGDRAGKLWVWDVRSKVGKWIYAGTAACRSVAFSPNGEFVAAGTNEGVVILDREAEEVARQFPLRKLETPLTRESERKSIWALEFSPSGESLAAACGDASIRIWNLNTEKKERAIIGHADQVRGLAFSPTGDRVYSGGREGAVKVWDMETLQEIESFQQNTYGIQSLALSADGSNLALAGADFSAVLAKTDALNRSDVVLGQGDVLAVMFCQNGTLVITESSPQLSVRIIDIGAGEETSRQLNLGSALRKAVVSENAVLAVLDEDNGISLWDLQRDSTDSKLRLEAGVELKSIAISHDGSLVTACSSDSKLRIWEASSGNLLPNCDLSILDPELIAFSPDDRKLAVANRRGVVVIYDVVTRTQLCKTEPIRFGLSSLAFSPDGKILAGGGLDGTISLIDSEDGTISSLLSGNGREVKSMVFSRSGTRLFSAGDGLPVRIWSVNQHQELLQLRKHPEEASLLAISPDDQTLVSLSESLTKDVLCFWRAERD